MGTFVLWVMLAQSQAGMPPAAADWGAVLKLPPGRDIVITTRRVLLAAERRLLAADETSVVVLDLSLPQLSNDARRALAEMAREHQDYAGILRGDTVFVHRDVRVAADGVFVAAKKVAETSDVVQRIPRPDVLLVATTKKRGSIIGAAVGAGVGFMAGAGLAIGIATENPCGESCSDEKALIALSIAGLPTAGGLLGYHALKRTAHTVVYRAPEIR